MLYYNSENEILQGTKAEWTLEWVVFYADDWDSANFKACVRIFLPAFRLVLRIILKSPCMVKFIPNREKKLFLLDIRSHLV